MMFPEPTAAHRWLDRLVGEWSVTSRHAGAADDAPAPPWTESVRSLSGLWVVAEGRGEMPDGGGPATTLVTFGYDPGRQRYVGTWVASMMTHLWLSEGTLDASGRVLTLGSEGPDFETEGALARYQDIITIEDDDHRTLTARVLAGDGTWKPLMAAHYRRIA